MSYASTVLADGAAAYWRLGESGAGSAVDQVGTASGTYNGSVTFAQSGIPGGGGGTVVLLTASGSGFMNTPSVAAVHLGDTFTLEQWVKRSSIGTIQVLQAGGASGDPLMRFNSDNTIGILRADTANIGSSTVTLTDTASFHHVVWTKATTTSHIYLDGVDVTGTITNSACNNTGGWIVGRDNPATTNYLDANTGEVAVYKAALSAGTVAAHYSLGNPVVPVVGNTSFDMSTAWTLLG